MARYPWQVQLPSLAEAFQGAAAMARTKMDIDDRQRAYDARLKRAEAVKAYRAGDKELLMIADPDLYQKFEGMGAQAAQAQAQAGQQQLKISQEKAAQAGRLGMALQADPRAYESARGAMLQSGLWSPEELPEVDTFSPEQAQVFSQQLIAQGQTVGGTETEQPKLDLYAQSGKIAAETFRAEYPEVPPHMYPRHPAWQSHLDAAEESLMKHQAAGASKVVMPGAGKELDKPTTTEQMKSITSAVDILAPLARIRGSAKKWMFTLGGKGRAGLARAVAHFDPDWVPKNDTEKLKAQRKVIQDTERLFLVFRKWATGVAGGEKEMAEIRKSMPTTDMTWPDFQASMEQLHEELTTKIRLSQRFLAESGGIPMDGEQLDQMINMALLNGDTGRSEVDVSRMLDALENENRPPVEIARQMAAAGYFDEKMANAWLRMNRGK